MLSLSGLDAFHARGIGRFFQTIDCGLGKIARISIAIG
jgi:hypothetical protein